MIPFEHHAADPTSKETVEAALERFRTRCFWWVRKEVALVQLPREMLIRGLQTHGGHEGMQLAARL